MIKDVMNNLGRAAYMAMVGKEKLTIKFKKLHKDATIPKYQTAGAAGMDLCALSWGVLAPNETGLIKTGLSVEIPPGYEGQVRSRSGLALKNGIVVLNSPGTIDFDFRGEIGVILHNTSTRAYTVNEGDRIAQLVIAPMVQAEVVEVTELSDTTRGTGGFGSTNIK
jgi:dUTP pyrophosphatase